MVIRFLSLLTTAANLHFSGCGPPDLGRWVLSYSVTVGFWWSTYSHSGGKNREWFQVGIVYVWYTHWFVYLVHFCERFQSPQDFSMRCWCPHSFLILDIPLWFLRIVHIMCSGNGAKFMAICLHAVWFLCVFRNVCHFHVLLFYCLVLYFLLTCTPTPTTNIY